MKRQSVATWLLLVAMLLLLSGAMLAVHDHLDHHQGGVSAHHDRHQDESNDPPPSPQPHDHDDCPTCFVLMHVKGSSLDFGDRLALSTAAALIKPRTPDRVISADSVRFPTGRGPPFPHFRSRRMG